MNYEIETAIIFFSLFESELPRLTAHSVAEISISIIQEYRPRPASSSVVENYCSKGDNVEGSVASQQDMCGDD